MVLRDLLFGDLPLRQWIRAGTGEPWDSFRRASEAVDAGDTVAARECFRGVLASPGLESRQYLQAWDGLRSLGERPAPAEVQHIYGVVLDVPVDGGCDTLAAYEDYSCRYLNHSGAVTIWDHPNSVLDQLIDRLFEAGRATVAQIGPWDGPRPEVPAGMARVSFLCAGGFHFGQATPDVLFEDPLGAPVLAAGTALLQALMDQAPG